MSNLNLLKTRSVVASWCLYDWANSAFTTLIVTFVYSTYFVEEFVADTGRGTALWSYGLTISAITTAMIAPMAGALADRGDRRRYLIGCTLLCVLMVILLTFVKPGQPGSVLMALGVFIVANVAFELALVFYNAFLPSIASVEKIGRISGYGWSLGYFGGLVCLALALPLVLSDPPPFGLSETEGFNIRAVNIIVAVWFLVFSIPMFLTVRDKPVLKSDVTLHALLSNFKRTIIYLKNYRDIVQFLIARLIYNDGLVTIFAFGGIYASSTFGFTVGEVIIFGIVLNAVAGFGAWIFGFIDDRIGGKISIQISLIFLIVFTLLAGLAPSRQWFWLAGCGIGLFLGPNQSASRSLMGRFTPKSHESEFFGFFAFSGKITSFLGPLLLGILSDVYNQRVGVLSVVLFFLVGGFLVWRIDERRGIAKACR